MQPEQRILVLTNDDGILAPGLQALVRAAQGLGECRVIAPCEGLSGCGHQVTTHAPLRITPDGAGGLAVSGTPADCVRLALFTLARDASWVLSGINAGGNLGTDVYHSGTVAAAREAAIRGVPAIALSQYIARGRTIDWHRASTWARRALRTLTELPWQPGTFWNVNLPHPAPDPEMTEPELVFCPLDPSPLPLDYQLEPGSATYRGVYQDRARRPGMDVAACLGGQIAVTLMVAADVPTHALPPGPGPAGEGSAKTPEAKAEIWPTPRRA